MSQEFVTRANAEQKNAIFHNGGVLLSAGAGSGKTFVLVEHIAYLIWKHHLDKGRPQSDEYILELKNHLSSIVLMTFTKKAAGELAIRLKNKMDDLLTDAADESQQWLWTQAKSCLDYLSVGTIDGFCFKLIAQGYFPGLPQSMAVVSEIESTQKIIALFDEWLAATFGQKLESLSGVESYFVSHRSEFCDAFVKIFTTPELRLLWRDMDPEKMLDYDWNDFMDVVFGTNHPKTLSESFPSADTNAKGAWVEKLSQLTGFFSSKQTWDLEAVLELAALFESNKNITTGPRTEGEIKDYFAKAKAVKDILKDISADLSAYETEGRVVLAHQVELMLSSFAWIERRYSQIPGYTFSDLEYYVVQGLKDEQARANVSSRYRYLIVDEFQDTSRIQFEIIRAIVDGDFSRLFCVGDEKQAIYGFRGGELQVFKDCKSLIPTNLSLANNYRSQGNIIDFNNTLFDNIFKRGSGYEGSDPHPVEVVPQDCPLDERRAQGVINKHQCEIQISEAQRVTESDMVEAECQQTLQIVQTSLAENPDEEICILYKGLKPSLSLMSKLISNEIGLRAQVKIPYPQDPILALFSCMVEGILLSQQQKVNLAATPVSFFVQNLLHYLALKVEVAELNDRLEVFQENIHALGLIPAFGDFVHQCGLANSNHAGNMAEIERICSLAAGDLEQVLTLFADLSAKKYSIEFQSPGKGRVVIMTAHASKGLQFPHIILGGIHNNGRKVPARDIVGKLPGSLKWRAHLDQKKKFKTPQMIVETCLDNLKEFAESKRLFYVACTRAERRISWVDLCDSNKKDLKYHGDSWINGIRTFEADTQSISKNSELFSTIKLQSSRSEQVLVDEKTSIVSEAHLPMFHLDPLGVTVFSRDKSTGLVAFPELSVTKFATLAECPRKFYLRHICKLEDEVFDRKAAMENTVIEETDEIFTPKLSSSAERGTLVHEAIAYSVTHKQVISLALQKQLGPSELSAVDWASKIVFSEYCSHQIISEQPIKFDLFGQMVSGTPDLVLLPDNGDEFVIVDFKTGRPGADKELPYWFQLKCYAFAIASTQPERNLKRVKIELWFVDTQTIKTESFTIDEITQFLAGQWSKLARPFTPVLEHCEKCTFGKICHP